MKHFLPKLDSTRVLIAAKTCLAIVLAFAITLRLDWKPSFMAIVIVVMQTDALGATLKKGLMYISATLSGAIVAVAMVGLFAHDRRLFILGMAILTGFGMYRMQGSRYAYAWLIFIVTAALVGWLAAQSTGSTFELAVMRSSTVAVGIVVAFSVHGILWPIKAGKTFERQLRGFLEGCRDQLSFTSRMLAGDDPDPAAVKKAEATQVKTIAALRSSLDAASADTQRFKRFHAGYAGLIDQLHDLLLVILAVRDGIESARSSQAGTPVVSGSSHLRDSAERLEGEVEELIRDLTRPRDGTAMATEPETIAEPDLGRSGPIETAYTVMIVESMRELASQASRVRATLSGVEDPRRAPPPLLPPSRASFSLGSPRFRKAAAGSMVIVVISVIFILTQWPMGLGLGMVFAMLAIGFGGMLPLTMIRRQLLLSLIIGPAIAAPLYFGVMPRIDQYEELIPWLCLVFLPLLYLQTSSNPRTMILMIFSSVFLIALLSLDEESQSYSFSSFLAMWLGFCGGFAMSLAIYALFETSVPEREFRKQVRSFFAGCGQAMRDLEESPPGTPAGAAITKAGRTQRLSQHKQMQVSSSVIDYKRVPGNDRPSTQALIESIERVAIRLDRAEHARRKPVDAIFEPLREPLRRLYDTCSESFQLIANSLADLKPVPDLPDTGPLIRDIESGGDDLCRSAAAGDDDARASALAVMSATAHLHSLADAIRDCREKTNDIDWAAWNRNYF